MGAAAEQDHETDERTVNARRDPLLGTLFDQRFRVDVKIAAGGFGAIYRATHIKSGHEFALKVLHANLTHDARVVARFRREGVALTRLRDPHTITAYELGETQDGTLYIVMELLHGESLYERYRTQGPLPWPRVMAVARGVCSSLAEAHAHGIIHRDLKPTNIHLEPRGADKDYVKVLDFGIAKILLDNDSDMDASDLTQVGQMIGTLDYMSPEQMVGGACTATTDIYTLGIVMYEMIAGHKPFDDANSAAAALAAVLTTTPQPLSELEHIQPAVNPAVDRLVMKCLERNSGDRYHSAVELATSIDDILSGRINLPVGVASRPMDDIPTAPVPTAASVRPAPAAVRAAIEARRMARASNQAIEKSEAPAQPLSRASAPRIDERPEPIGDRESSPDLLTEPQRPSNQHIDRRGRPPESDAGDARSSSPQLASRGSAAPVRPSVAQILPRNRRASSPPVAQPGEPPRRDSSPKIVVAVPSARASTPSLADLGQPAPGAAEPSSPPLVIPGMPAPRPMPADSPAVSRSDAAGTGSSIEPRPHPGALPRQAEPASSSEPRSHPGALPRQAEPASSSEPAAAPSPMLRLLSPPPRIPSTPSGGSTALPKSLREVYPTIHLQPPSPMRPPLTAFDDRPTTAIGQLSPREMAQAVRRKVAVRRVKYGVFVAIAVAVAAIVVVAIVW